MYIRTTMKILRALRDTHKDAPKRLPHNLVFAAPTMTALATAVYGAMSADGPSQSYTGTTGSFGCDTLEHLLRDETVGKVYHMPSTARARTRRSISAHSSRREDWTRRCSTHESV